MLRICFYLPVPNQHQNEFPNPRAGQVLVWRWGLGTSMFKGKIPKPRSHVQCPGKFPMPKSQCSKWFFGGALAFPKRSPSQKYEIVFDAFKIRSHFSCSKPSFSETHVSCSKIPKPKSHVQSPDVKSQDSKSQLQVSCSKSKFWNWRLIFNVKIPKPISPVQTQILSNFRGVSVPKTEPLPEVQNIVWCAQNPKPTFHVQSQVSKTHVTFKAKSRSRNPRLMFKTKMFRVKIPKPRVSCSKSRFQIPIASLMFIVKFPKPRVLLAIQQSGN